MLDLLYGNGKPPTKYNLGLALILTFRLDRIYSFGDIGIFIGLIATFWPKIAYILT